ncbi:MAG: mRNA surveillance protein pelota [Candidatus Thermoplasmatota archaeon]|nr:mRNA surveillance protein pelota [Candidatus Thermoplasmatota archaeon]
MKVVFKDLKHGEIKLIAENLDDIWHLYNIIDEQDLVRAVTFRTDEQKDDKIRSKKAEKKRMKLGVRVAEVRFHEFSDRLRIHGTIEEGPQDLGSFHTLNVTADKMDAISIVKDAWKEYQLQRIDEAVKQRNQPILTFVCLDEDSATIAVLRQSGLQWIADIDSKRSGKMYESKDVQPDYFGEVFAVVKMNKTEHSTLVVLGPGFTKEHFVRYAREKDPEAVESMIVHGTGNAGMNGVNEAIKTGIVEQITKENRVVFETGLVEKLFEEIKKDGMAAYGEHEVLYALQNGAVERVLITDILVRTTKGESFLQMAKQHNSQFTIINTLHEGGKKLEGIGGVGALLRFRC